MMPGSHFPDRSGGMCALVRKRRKGRLGREQRVPRKMSPRPGRGQRVLAEGLDSRERKPDLLRIVRAVHCVPNPDQSSGRRTISLLRTDFRRLHGLVGLCDCVNSGPGKDQNYHHPCPCSSEAPMTPLMSSSIRHRDQPRKATMAGRHPLNILPGSALNFPARRSAARVTDGQSET